MFRDFQGYILAFVSFVCGTVSHLYHRVNCLEKYNVKNTLEHKYMKEKIENIAGSIEKIEETLKETATKTDIKQFMECISLEFKEIKGSITPKSNKKK